MISRSRNSLHQLRGLQATLVACRFHRLQAVEALKILEPGTDAPMDDVIARVTDTSDRGRALRQTSPFAGVLGPRERWEILRRCRGQAVAS